jgi:hypothetical protein
VGIPPRTNLPSFPPSSPFLRCSPCSLYFPGCRREHEHKGFWAQIGHGCIPKTKLLRFYRNWRRGYTARCDIYFGSIKRSSPVRLPSGLPRTNGRKIREAVLYLPGNKGEWIGDGGRTKNSLTVLRTSIQISSSSFELTSYSSAHHITPSKFSIL